MDIPEVEIGRKKISHRTISASQKWLYEKGVDLEDLSEPQREAVFHFIKQKRGLLWLMLISVPCVILYVVGISFFAQITQDNDEVWIPQEYAVENEKGEKVYQEVPESLEESISSYGKLSLLFGAIIGGLLYALASNIAGPIVLHQSIKRNGKTISAFLPNDRG